MNKQYAPNWIEASAMLRRAMERYRDKNRKKSLSAVLDDVIDYIYNQTKKELDKKTIRRDIGNKTTSKKLHPIPNWRIEIYAKWLYEETLEDRKWIEGWLGQTAYPSPGNLMTEVFDGEASPVVKTNVPPLRKYLWGNFLGRQAELKRLQQWADHQRFPTAVLCGFGGNGKTTIQLKVGEEFMFGVKCPLRWPYEGAVWVSGVDYSRGQPNLLDVLRKVAETFELFDKEINLEQIRPDVITKEIKELLEERRVLMLLDNFETVSKPNQIEILKFFNNLRGSSQILISTRYRPDWFLERDQDEMYSMAHALIRVNGLSSEDAETLVQDFLTSKPFFQNDFDQKEIKRLIEVTQNNPKAIIAVLGLIEQGISLSHLLDAITSGEPEADQIYEKVIDQAWEQILTEHDKAVLMAKAFFSRSVDEGDLGQMAGVTGEQLQKAIKKLGAISFFEFERTLEGTRRIRTHPLAQDFSYRVLRDHPEFEDEAEQRWWKEYGPNIIQKAGQIAYKSINPELEENIANVTAHVEKHICDKGSSYRLQAAEMFGKYGGFGHVLNHWGKWDEMLRLAKLVLEFSIEHQNPRLIGECALRLISGVFRRRGEFDEVDRYICLASEQNARLKDRWLGARIDFARADVCRQRGYFRAAEQFYQKALEVFLDLEKRNKAKIAVTYIAVTYALLGIVTVEIATESIEEAIDKSSKMNTKLTTAQDYFTTAENYFGKSKDKNINYQLELTGIHLWRGRMARIQGKLDDARNLLENCRDKFSRLLSVAQVYRELALVEHLAGNKELAYFYEEKGLNLFRQLGIIETLPPYHCYKVIDHMKKEGTW